MSIPANFGSAPREDLNHHFRNVCIEVRKTLQSSKDNEKLELELDRFMNVAQGMNWNHKNSEIYKKDESEKAVNKFVREYKRYLEALQNNGKKPTLQDVLNALTDVESLVRNLKAV